MEGTMTKAQGVCACSNVLDLIEDLMRDNPKFRSIDYSTSTQSFIEGLKKNITGWRGTNITEKMDGAIRKTWMGLRRWDRKQLYNDELFLDLGDYENDPDLTAAIPREEARASASIAPRPSSMRSKTESQVTDEILAGLSPAQQAKLDAMSAKSKPTPVAPAVAVEEDPMPDWMGGPVNPKSKEVATEPVVVSRADDGTWKNKVETTMLNCRRAVIKQFDVDKITVVPESVVRSPNLHAILKKTASDRTQQLIKAAYHAGKVAGMRLLFEEVKSG